MNFVELTEAAHSQDESIPLEQHHRHPYNPAYRTGPVDIELSRLRYESGASRASCVYHSLVSEDLKAEHIEAVVDW